MRKANTAEQVGPPARGVLTPEPLADLPADASIPYQPVLVGGSDAAAAPGRVTNWDYFQGALLGVGVRRGDLFEILGTGVMIAPGLAITATHNLRDDFPALERGDVGALCLGVRTGVLDLWRIRSISHNDVDDLAYLSLQLASPLTDTWRFTSIPITTRCPRPPSEEGPGEVLTILGFRFPEAPEFSDGGWTAAGDLFAAAGTVTAVYHPIRDRVLLPGPTIEIACGSLGGMSGGAVLDQSGMLMGLISSGLDHEDGAGPTFAAWVIGALDRQLGIPWPPGLYKDRVGVMEIPEQLLHIAGREAIRVTSPGRTRYRIWFDRPEPVRAS